MTLLLTFLSLLAVVIIIGTQVLGRYLNPIIALVLFELVFNFVTIPVICKNYYLLHGYNPPELWKRIIPFHNLTIVMSPMSARLSIFSLMVTIMLLTLSYNISILSFVGTRWFLNIVDYFPLFVSLSFLLHFVFVGFGLGGVSLKINELYRSYFDDDSDSREGFIKLLSGLLSSSKYLSVVLYMLPVVRIIPGLNTMEQSMDLVKFSVIFPYADDPHDDEYEEDVYDEEY